MVGYAACSSASLAYCTRNVTDVSVDAIVLSVATTVDPYSSSAVPPVAIPAVMVADARKPVFVEFRLLVDSLPPNGVNDGAPTVRSVRSLSTTKPLVPVEPFAFPAPPPPPPPYPTPCVPTDPPVPPPANVSVVS